MSLNLHVYWVPLYINKSLTSSKTFLRPFCVRAEHSTYLTALSSLASLSPISRLRGFCLFFARVLKIYHFRKYYLLAEVSGVAREVKKSHFENNFF